MNSINNNFSSPIVPNQPRVIEGISIQPISPTSSLEKSIPANFVIASFPNIPIINISAAVNKS
jgi:hypothetical protein